VEDKLRTFLKNEPSVAAVLGDRIYPRRLKQKATLPALVYQRIDTPRTPVHREKSIFPRPRMQLRIWSKTSKTAWQAANVVREALDGFCGDMGNLTVARSVIVNEFEDDDLETGLVSVVQDYQITYQD
jgi:hypothetical protein